MKLNIKKGLLWLVVVLMVAIMSITLVDCTVFQQDVSTDALITARDTIRQSNISIETIYYRDDSHLNKASISGRGSGVVFKETDTTYYALTNYHVITDTYKTVTYYPLYTVTDINGYTYSAKLEMGNQDEDIAIVSFTKQTGSVLKTINYSKRLIDNVTLGELVLAVGNPSGVNNIVTYGKVLGRARISNVSYTVINHNALINPGNSGGALCDIDGNLLGLNTWGTDGSDDDNFAIPLLIIDNFINEFIEQKFPDEEVTKINLPADEEDAPYDDSNTKDIPADSGNDSGDDSEAEEIKDAGTVTPIKDLT